MSAIVVVDDSPTIRHLLTFALKQDGYDVHVAGDGDEALGVIRELRPVLVITDARMPVLDGYDLCREVRADDSVEPQPYFIMVTDSGKDIDRERAAEVGVEDFLTKPFSPSSLRARVREILQA